MAATTRDVCGETGTVLARQWQPNDGMMVLVRGSVHICCQDEPRARTDALGMLSAPGDSIGVGALLFER